MELRQRSYMGEKKGLSNLDLLKKRVKKGLPKAGDKVDAPGSAWHGAEYINVYTRQQALRDGFLVDVTEKAKEAGFKWPMAFSTALWTAVEKTASGRNSCDLMGILWDIFTVMRFKIRGSRGSVIKFRVKIGRKNHDLMSVVGPGDRGEPVMTVGYPSDF